MKYFRNLIGYLVYEKNWYLLELFISILAELEIGLRICFTKGKKNSIEMSDVVNSSTGKSYAQEIIPENTFYCSNCPFWELSYVARFFYGNQTDGFCTYLGKGDFSFFSSTMLLWDGCKECGINEFSEEE